MTKLVAVLAVSLVALAGVANAATKTVANDIITGKPSLACPRGKTGVEGVCVASKNGKMGFDLAAPADNNVAATSSQSASSRSVSKNSSSGH